MNKFNRNKSVNDFIDYWSKNNFNYKEQGNTASFWIDLLSNVYGVNEVTKYIDFEKNVPNMEDNMTFIDAYIPRTKVLIEQKSPNTDLSKKEYRPSFKQYDCMVTPFEQAKTYNDNLAYSQRARWIITSNFKQFWIYDMEKSGTHPKPVIMDIFDLRQYYYKMDFLVDSTRQNIQQEAKISLKASEIIDEIYHEFLNCYSKEQRTAKVRRDINKLCVRLVFCLYADDSKIFGKKDMFRDYMKNITPNIWNIMLNKLFNILNTPEDKRNLQDDPNILKFPYVNGGLFADNENDKLQIPLFTQKMKDLIIERACSFDWSKISPTIFGSLFEGTLNPDERHKNGMHYTSVTNIHKVIDPLFLDDLRNDLNQIKTRYTSINIIKEHAQDFQTKLSKLTFLDPACGSGNFLTETYISLRKLENEAIKLIYKIDGGGYIQTILGLNQHIIKVSIKQFYGIEINDFAVAVGRTAMWIADSQMTQQTQDIINQQITFLPLKTNPNIIEKDALLTDWSKLISPNCLDYIISNPPFRGNQKSKMQRSDMNKVMKGFKTVGQLDLVAAWYKKSADMMNQSKNIKTALVSTNSITLGQQAAVLWKPLLSKEKFHINFAYQSFLWKNGSKEQASVACVIIGFSHFNNKDKVIFKNNDKLQRIPVKSGNINPYLRDMPNVFITRRREAISKKAPKMAIGSKPNDWGYLSRYSDQEKNKICYKYPKAKNMFRRFLGASEFTKNKIRWCLWLPEINTSDWANIAPIRTAVMNVKYERTNSYDKSANDNDNTPELFQDIRQPQTDYLLIPKTSSFRRKYIPIGFISKNNIINDGVFAVTNATYYDFGLLTSIVHVTWARLVSGRMGEGGFRYSNVIAYNNFPYLYPSKNKVNNVIKTGMNILSIRNKYPDSNLDMLYNPDIMPNDLLEAHKENDRAVLEIYGLKSTANEEEILTKLLKLYNRMAK